MTSTTRTLLTCCLCLFEGIFGNIAGSVIYNQAFRTSVNGNRHLKLFSISLERCVFECDVRAKCKAVIYWRQRQKCSLLATVVNNPDKSQLGSVFVRKTDITQSSIPVGTCSTCNKTTVCDIETNSCIIKECPIKARLSNGAALGNILEIGSKVNVVCNNGYYVDPSNKTFVCQNNGLWSVQDPCKPVIVDCGEPPTLTNANVSVGGTIEGAVRNYTCIEGYHAASAASSPATTCLQTGQWTELTFECRLIDCGEPPSLTNATVSSGDTVEGAVRSYTCIQGHAALSGSSLTSTCLGTGQWTALTFACGLKTCENGWHQISDTCYYIEQPTPTIDALGAVSYCHDRQAYLVQLETQRENDDVIAWARNTVPRNPLLFWIGLSDADLDGTWIWTETGKTCTFLHGNQMSRMATAKHTCWFGRLAGATLGRVITNTDPFPFVRKVWMRGTCNKSTIDRH